MLGISFAKDAAQPSRDTEASMPRTPLLVFLASKNRGYGASAIRDLGVCVIGLDERDVVKLVKRKFVLFASFTLLLADINAGCCNGADTHAIAKK